MTERLAISLLTTLANLGLGLAVLFKNSSQRGNRRFAFFSITLAAWTAANGLVDSYAASPFGIVWARAAFLAASVIPASFLYFVAVFPAPEPVLPDLLRRLVATGSLVTAVISLTPLIAKATASAQGVLQVEYGPLHLYFGLYFVLTSGYAIFFLMRKLRVLQGVENLQVRYVLLGVTLTALGATITNLVVPLVFRSSALSPYGPVMTLFLIGFIAHSIIRYRLMNIRLVIRRSVTYLLTGGIAGVIFISLVWLASRLFSLAPQELPLWGQLTLVLLIAVTVPPLKTIVQAWIDRYLFREPYDYRRAVREISRGMAAILDLRSLLHYVCAAITKTVRPEFVAVYAADVGTSLYRCIIAESSIGILAVEKTIGRSSALIGVLAAHKKHVLADETGRGRVLSTGDPVVDDLNLLNAELILPLLEDEQLTGFFVLGRKLSGDPYFAEDIDLLTTLVSQASIAIKNAQLYSQVLLANEYVENILATMENAVIAVDAEGQVTLFNTAAQRLLRLDVSQVKGSHLRQLPAPVAAPLEATLADGQSAVQLETTIQDGAGTLTPAICSTSPLRDRTGKTLGAVGVFSDLTRLKSLEEQKRLAERFASIGALAAGIAHEIKNPLVAIKTFAELLPERFTEEDFRTDFSQVVIREIERIDDLVARLRGLAAAPAPLRLPLNLRAPLEETLALLRGQFEQAQVVVKTTYDPDLPLVVGDPAQLKQLFLNLLVNSLEAMEPGSDLFVRVVAQRTGEKETLLVEVTDSGSGIPDNLLGKIFDPFVTSKPRGSGLGLSICRGIAEAHGASIHAENNRGGPGATLTVEFPVYKPSSVAVEPSYKS